MKLLPLVIITVLFCTHAAFAACIGRDLRLTLTPAEQREINDRLASSPYADGNHWIARNGAQEIHLIGTVHVHDPRLLPIMESLAPLLDRADLLLLEGTEVERKKLETAVATRPELLFLQTGPTLPDRLSEEDWQKLAAAARLRGIPPFMAAKMQPWYLSLLLSVPACALDQARTEKPGFDALLMQAATERDLPQQALEPYETLFTLMGQEPIEKQIEYIRLGLLPERAARDAVVTLLASYFEDRPAEVIEVSRVTAREHLDLSPEELDRLTDDMLDKILVQRNFAWMPHILAAPEGVTVVAVGAAHLPGVAGLVQLLAKEGYALTRVPFCRPVANDAGAYRCAHP